MKTLPLSRLQTGSIVLLIVSGVGLLSFTEQPVAASAPTMLQDEIAAPPNKNAMEKFMARKLVAAQRTLEAIAKDDFESVSRLTTEMIDLSKHEAWERMASARFVQDTADFVSAAEFLQRMANAQDPEGVSLGFTRLTSSCTTCHGHIRKAAVADLKPIHRTVVAQR